MRALVAAALVLVPGAAHAGALSDVIHGLDQATGNNSGGQGNPAPNVIEQVVDAVFDADWSMPATGPDPGVVVVQTAPPPSFDTEVSAYAGIQSVVDSDRSLTLEVRASTGNLGVDLRGT